MLRLLIKKIYFSMYLEFFLNAAYSILIYTRELGTRHDHVSRLIDFKILLFC